MDFLGELLDSPGGHDHRLSESCRVQGDVGRRRLTPFEHKPARGILEAVQCRFHAILAGRQCSGTIRALPVVDRFGSGWGLTPPPRGGGTPGRNRPWYRGRQRSRRTSPDVSQYPLCHRICLQSATIQRRHKSTTRGAH